MMTWIDNIYQKFENMIQEVEDTMLEEFQYLDNQMSIVGESVKKLYSTAMEDLLAPSTTSPSTTSAPVLPIGHYVGISEKSLQHFIKSTMDSSINLDSDYCVKANNLKSGAKPLESVYIESKVGSNINQQNNTDMPASETTIEAIVAKEASVIDCSNDCSNEIENTSMDENRGVEVLVEPVEEKEENMSSFSSDIYEDDIGFSTIKAIQQDGELKLDQSCVIISKDELQFAHNASVNLKHDQTCVLIAKDELQFSPNATFNLKTREKKWLQPFSLIKKSARKQEYKELALLHGIGEHGSDDCIDPEWELL